MMRTTWFHILWLFMALLPVSVGAVPLENALGEILTTHPRILEQLNVYNNTVYDLDRSRSQLRPMVDLQAESGYDGISNGSTRYQRKSFGVGGARLVAKKLLMDGKRTQNDIRARESTARAALFGYFETLNETAIQAIEAYIAVLKYQELLRLSEENVEIHRRLSNSIRARVEAGTSGKSEVERVQGRLAAAQSLLMVRQNDYTRAVFRFRTFYGRTVEGNEMVKPVFEPAWMPGSLEEALIRQQENHPVLLAADSTIAAKTSEWRRERAGFRPETSLQAVQDWRRNYGGIQGEDRESSLILKVSVPLMDGGFRKNRMAQYESLVHREQYARNDEVLILANDLQAAWTEFQLLDSQIGALKKSNLFTRQALRSYREEFKLGKRLLINILDAESEYQGARSVLAASKYDLLATKFRILSRTGTLVQVLDIGGPLTREFAQAKSIRAVGRDSFSPRFDAELSQPASAVAGPDPNSKTASEASAQVAPPKNSDPNGKTASEASVQAAPPESPDPDAPANEAEAEETLQSRPLLPDVPRRMEYFTFEKGSDALSETSQVILHEIQEQLKKYKTEGMVRVTVHSGDAGSKDENYRLSVQRAYNIKKTLTSLNLDPDFIQISTDFCGSPTRESFVIFTVVTDPAGFRENVETIENTGIRFSASATELLPEAKAAVASLAQELKRIGAPPVDIVVYGNDSNSPQENVTASGNRAKAIRQALGDAGINIERVVPVAWGNFDEPLDLYENASSGLGRNKVECLIREKR